jgi:hypothetical protein
VFDLLLLRLCRSSADLPCVVAELRAGVFGISLEIELSPKMDMRRCLARFLVPRLNEPSTLCHVARQ